MKLTSETYVEVLLYKNCTLILCQALPGLFSFFFSEYFNNYLQLRLYVKQDYMLKKKSILKLLNVNNGTLEPTWKARWYLQNGSNLVPRSPTVRRKGDLVKFDLRPGIRACPSSFVHNAEWPPARNCDHSW